MLTSPDNTPRPAPELFDAPAMAAEPAPELRALLDGFYGLRRVALGYLRAENPDLAAIEIERLRARWTADVKKLPTALASDRDLAAALTATDAAVAESLAAIDAGDGTKARTRLRDAATALDAWRRGHDYRQEQLPFFFQAQILEITSSSTASS